ncbi:MULTISPECIES: hypothetical protein [Ralstonia solanacearum species complex]|uniref:hypothetical protein n=1 Tax=Ralstonia solanacearum species complex TaxID=3116862 RepID=UPI0011408A3F|nr:hypothetical protein [Ralstonia solanacearum]QOK81543.1 hypothetical protein HF906_04845 [Ralstonia solanacearum]
MNYFSEAFDGFRPGSDRDAALKFSLCMMAIDNRMEDLLQLIKGANNLGGVEGDPGWIIERRESGETIGYEKWPNSAHFRAYVDTDDYSLLHPEFFADRQTFFRYVGAIVKVYKIYHPEYAGVVDRIEGIIAPECS